jgi:L-alanine-DL-glutamate epimerase-like enolase superfamily enzyme
VSLKAIKLGGIRAVVEAGRRADDLRMRVNVSCKTGESSVGCAAALHIASVIPNVAWGLTLTHTGLADDVVTDPIWAERGYANVPDRPGLGVEVDEDRVRRYQAPV